MNRRRWQHLDRARPVPSTAPSASPPPEVGASKPPAQVELKPAVGSGEDRPGALQSARTFYRLGDYALAAELARRLIAQGEAVAGAHHVLGLALARLDDLPGAIGALTAAAALAPADMGVLASLLSARIRAGEVGELPPQDAAGPAGELAGAAAWLRGQQLLRTRHSSEAAACFTRATELFSAHSPAGAAGERTAAAYIGAAISYLAGGFPTLAQQQYASLVGRREVPDTTLAFARQLYELADLIEDLSPEERAAAVDPLVELVLSARLCVSLYDGTAAVKIQWES